MLKRIKQNALSASKSLGVFKLAAASGWRRRRLLILAYHGVSLGDEHLWNPELYMTAEQLAARFEIIRRGDFAVLPLGEAVARLYEGRLPARALAITFDDGNYDFYARALPVIEEFGFPVTSYLTTYYSGYNRPVFDVMVPYLIWKAGGATLGARDLTGEDLSFDLSEERQREAARHSLLDFAARARLSGEEKDALASRLAARLGVDYGALLESRVLHLMTPEEVTRTAARGVDVQLHTHRHRVPDDPVLFAREIEENRRAIEALTAREAVHFCYPSGVHKPQFLPWLAAAGVRSATTCDPDIASSASDALLLPRLIDTSRQSPVEFEGWLTGVSAFLPQRPQARAA